MTDPGPGSDRILTRIKPDFGPGSDRIRTQRSPNPGPNLTESVPGSDRIRTRIRPNPTPDLTESEDPKRRKLPFPQNIGFSYLSALSLAFTALGGCGQVCPPPTLKSHGQGQTVN